MERVRSPLPTLARIRHGHIALRRARPHLPEAVWRAYFKFAVVRNPWDRFVSACAMLNTRNAGYAGNEAVWMKRTLANLRGGVNHGTFESLMLLRTQTGLLVDEDGRFGVDFLGRYENLQDSFAAICGRLGIPEQPLPTLNATARGAPDPCYDDELRRLVTDFYRRDFALLGYSPHPPARRNAAASCR